MKTILVIASACLLSLSIAAKGDHGNEYCAKKKEGKVYVMHNGKEITSDVTLNNGTTIKTDGTIVKKDGSKSMIKEGECLKEDGTMEKEHMKKEGSESKDHMKKETKKESEMENPK